MLVSPGDVHSEAWLRAEADSFVIYTDVSEADARKLAQHLSTLADLAPQFLPVSKSSAAAQKQAVRDLELLVFAKRRDFAKLLKPRHFVAFTRPGLESTLLLLAPFGDSDSLFTNMRHEYAHYHLRKQGLYYPPWFDEGIASLFEHVEINREGIAALNSFALFERYREPLRDSGRLSFKRLLNTPSFAGWPRARLQRFYGLSGQLAHFLEFGHERGLPDRRAALHKFFEQGSVDLAASLATPLPQLEREFRRYRDAPRKPTREIKLRSRTLQVSITPMDASEVLALQGRAAEGANPVAMLVKPPAGGQIVDVKSPVPNAPAQVHIFANHKRFIEPAGLHKNLFAHQKIAGRNIEEGIVVCRPFGPQTHLQ